MVLIKKKECSSKRPGVLITCGTIVIHTSFQLASSKPEFSQICSFASPGVIIKNHLEGLSVIHEDKYIVLGVTVLYWFELQEFTHIFLGFSSAICLATWYVQGPLPKGAVTRGNFSCNLQRNRWQEHCDKSCRIHVVLCNLSRNVAKIET